MRQKAKAKARTKKCRPAGRAPAPGTQETKAVRRVRATVTKGGKPKGAGPAAGGRMAVVAAQVRALQAGAALSPVMDRQEILEFLTLVKRTAPDAVDGTSEICQRVKVTATSREVWMLDKRACVELAARLLGYLPEKSKVEAPGKVRSYLALTEERRRVLMEMKRAVILRRTAGAVSGEGGAVAGEGGDCGDTTEGD